MSVRPEEPQGPIEREFRDRFGPEREFAPSYSVKRERWLLRTLDMLARRVEELECRDRRRE